MKDLDDPDTVLTGYENLEECNPERFHVDAPAREDTGFQAAPFIGGDLSLLH